MRALLIISLLCFGINFTCAGESTEISFGQFVYGSAIANAENSGTKVVKLGESIQTKVFEYFETNGQDSKAEVISEKMPKAFQLFQYGNQFLVMAMARQSIANDDYELLEAAKDALRAEACFKASLKLVNEVEEIVK